jgi:hypothetical protein
MKVLFAGLAFIAIAGPVLAEAAPPAPLPGAGCHVWKVYFHELIEHHRSTAAPSKTAVEKALDRSYATYARCVMSSCSDEQLISAAAEIRLALLNGSVLAASD